MGGLQVEAALDAPDHARRLHRHRRASRRSPASSRRTRSSGRPTGWAATGSSCGRIGVGGGGPHRLLHVPPLLDDLRRELPRHRRAGAPRPRVAADDDRPAPGPGAGLDPRRLPRRAGACSAAANFIEHFLEPVFEHAHHALGEVFQAPVPGHGVELALMGLSVLRRGGRHPASATALLQRGPSRSRRRLAASFPGAYRTLLNKYWVDEIYGAVFVRGLVARRRHGAPRERPLRDRRRRRRGAGGARRQRRRLGRARPRGEGLEPLGPLRRGRRRQPHRVPARQPAATRSGPCRAASCSTTRSAC